VPADKQDDSQRLSTWNSARVKIDEPPRLPDLTKRIRSTSSAADPLEDAVAQIQHPEELRPAVSILRRAQREPDDSRSPDVRR
jgi:hypothetical protein